MRSAARGRWEKAFKKYLSYPFEVRKSSRVDVVHVLDHSYTHLLQQVPRSTFKIVTVHDLAPLEDSTGLTQAQLRRFRKTVSRLRDADLLLSDSAYTAQALRNFLQTDLPICVLPLGVDADAYSHPRSLDLVKPLPTAPLVLSIGSTLGRKNLRILPEVMERVIREFGPVALVRVGGRLDNDLLTALAKVMPAEHIVELGGLSEEQLIALYQRAKLLLFPSTLEGFGLPIIEAMGAGCPVVSSNASSLPEVGADAALYFDPLAPEEAAAQTCRLLGDEELRIRLIDRGRRRALELSWQNHFDQLTSYYLSENSVRTYPASARVFRDRSEPSP